MKKSPILLLCLVAAFGLRAQTLTKAFTADGNINLMITNGDLKIETHKGTDVEIVAIGYEDPPERAKGLRPLSAFGAVNTTMGGLGITINAGTMNIVKTSNQSIDYRIKVPEKVNLQIKETGWTGSGNYHLKGCRGEIAVESTGSDIVLEDVSGPVVLKSTSGTITVSFSDLNTEQPSSIVNTSGEIDVAFPANARANMKLRSISGEIYSDLDLEIPGSDFKNMYTSSFEGLLNGGGVEISLHAISGNIYLRKK